MLTYTAKSIRGPGGVFDQIAARNPAKGEEFEVKERLSNNPWERFQVN